MQKLLLRVYGSRGLSLLLKIISYSTVALCCAAYLAMLLHFGHSDPVAAVKLVAVSGVPFVIVTLVRALIDAPRPYELYDFYEVKPKGRAGRSFPSRHVFSAFMIATLFVRLSLPIAAVLFVLSVLLAFARVALGIHFVRDALAGALIGVIAGALGILI